MPLSADSCKSGREGLDPSVDGVPGDGAHEFLDVSVPVDAVGAIEIYLAARTHVRRDVG